MSQPIRRHGTCRSAGGLLGPGQPAYRARQLYEAIYREQISDLAHRSRPFRRACGTILARRHEVGLPARRPAVRIDPTEPAATCLSLDDGRTVETVLMPEGDRDTICISSQVGCPVDCKFCMTALMGLERSLTAGEIVGQVLLVSATTSCGRTAAG